MIQITINHDWCICEWEGGIADFVTLKEAAGYFVKDAWMSPMYHQMIIDPLTGEEKRMWDGRRSLFRKHPRKDVGKFPAGLYHSVLSRLMLRGCQVHVVDNRTYPEHTTELAYDKLLFDPREYQFEASLAQLTRRRGIVSLPTAAGKTKTSVATIATLDLPMLWITHESSLARQSIRAIQDGIDRCPKVGTYWGESKNIQRWTVGIVNSLHKHRNALKWWFKQIKILVMDETHRGASDMWYDVAMSIPAPFRFGISATPFERSDGKILELVGSCGDIIYERAAHEEGIREYLSRPHVEMIYCPPGWILASDWQGIYKLGVVENEWRNQQVIDRALRSFQERSACIVFVNSIAHGRYFESALAEAAGTSKFHAFISGDTPTSVREEYWSKLRRGEMYALIATDGVAGEGADVPALKRVVVASGLKAAIIVKQRIGRGMRPKESTEDGWGGEVFIHDFMDQQHPKLLEHSRERRGYYESIGAIIEETHVPGANLEPILHLPSKAIF